MSPIYDYSPSPRFHFIFAGRRTTKKLTEVYLKSCKYANVVPHNPLRSEILSAIKFRCLEVTKLYLDTKTNTWIISGPNYTTHAKSEHVFHLEAGIL